MSEVGIKQPGSNVGVTLGVWEWSFPLSFVKYGIYRRMKPTTPPSALSRDGRFCKFRFAACTYIISDRPTKLQVFLCDRTKAHWLRRQYDDHANSPADQSASIWSWSVRRVERVHY